MTKELFTILTWNLNGYRARIDEVKSSRKLIEKFEADIICLQETKLKEDSSTYHVGGYGDKFNFSKTIGKTNVPYA
ncbi:DNA-(apurinic or apyrimidinic site) lyase 2 isoform X2, partial [Biomphalaria pfeifferi]